MKWANYIKRTAVRRVVWIVVGLLVYAALSLLGVAEAQEGNCWNSGVGIAQCSSKQEAYEAATAHAQAHVDQSSNRKLCVFQSNPPDSPWIARSIGAAASCPSSTSNSWSRSWAVECPNGGEWRDDLKRCDVGCSERDPLGPHSAAGSTTVCSDGCQFEQGGGICLGAGATAHCFGNTWEPTGNSCAAGDATPKPHNPNADTCRSTGGGWNECVKPNGDYCVTGAKGTRLCWTPGDTGPRSDAMGQEWADRQPTAENLAPPSNVENPTQETTNADKGGVSGEGVGGSFVMIGGSGTGNTGGQGNTGPGGTGSGKGGEGGDEEGEGAGKPGPVKGKGDLYEGSGKTLGGVFAEFSAQAQQSPLVSVGAGIFGGCSAGGSCPTETWSASEWNITADLTMLCQGVLAGLVAFAGWVALAGMGLFGFRVAFL